MIFKKYVLKKICHKQEYINALSEENTSSNKQLWLDYVWSLTILNRASTKHVSSVLNNKFVINILSRYLLKCKLLWNQYGEA